MLEIVEDYVKIRDNVHDMVFDYIMNTDIPLIIRCDVFIQSRFGYREYVGDAFPYGTFDELDPYNVTMAEILDVISNLEEDSETERYYDLLEHMLLLGARTVDFIE